MNSTELKGKTKLHIPSYDKEIDVGVIYYLKYPLQSGGMIEVATTRPETILGDTALAINPTDIRYRHLHNTFAVNPLTHCLIPIICDEFVDINFGTGVVKITPAHNLTDYDVGLKHKLQILPIFDLNGVVLPSFGKYSGQKRFDARFAIIKHMKEIDLFVKVADNPMTLPLCSRTDDIIEPMLLDQWFLNTDTMSEKAIEAVDNGSIKIIPEFQTKIWNHWLKQKQPWCISRQLWFGHRIPVWFNKDGSYIVARTEAEAKEIAKTDDLIQDPDCLDTWFSSALLPFSVHGWPHKLDEDLFPLDLMETGSDILFFWVARMAMLSIELTGKIPFKEVYLHQMVRDANGEKMSKTKGNVIDPVDVNKGISLSELENRVKSNTNVTSKELDTILKMTRKTFPKGIGECGTDGLRMALCSYAIQGADINLDVNKIVSYRHFCNKIWNSALFSFDKFKTHDVKKPAIMCYPINQWILSKLDQLILSMDTAICEYKLDHAMSLFYDFWMHKFCDVYLEATKFVFKETLNINITSETVYTLFMCLENGLRLLAPIAPFITAELYEKLHLIVDSKSDNIHSMSYPVVDSDSNVDTVEIETLDKNIDTLLTIVQKIRTIKCLKFKNPNLPVDVILNLKFDIDQEFAYGFIATLAKTHPIIELDIDLDKDLHYIDENKDYVFYIKK